MCHSFLWNYPLSTWSSIESFSTDDRHIHPFSVWAVHTESESWVWKYILKVKVEYESTYWKWKAFPMSPEKFLIFFALYRYRTNVTVKMTDDD